MVQLSIKKEESLARGLIEFDPPLPGKLSFLQEIRQVIATGQILYEGKSLIVDTFTDLQIWMELILDTENAYGSISCKTSKRTFPLHQCTFISMEDGPIIIHLGTLYFSSSMIEWNILKRGWKSEIFEVDFKEIENLKELLEERLTISGDSQILPKGRLHLTDGSGGFANLSFLYGNTEFDAQDPAKILPNGAKRAFNDEKDFEKLLLETAFIKKNMGQSHYFCPLDKVQSSLQKLKEDGFSIVFQNREVLLYSDKNLQWTAGDTLTLKGSLHFENDQKIDLVDAVLSKEKFLPVSATHVALLPDKKELGLPVGEPFEIIAGSIVYSRTSVGLSYDHLMKTYETPLQQFPLIDPSNHFKGALRPYQRVGLSWMHYLWQQKFAALLADDMGLGKTVQILALLSHIPGPHCIVVPKSLVANWEREIERFLPTKKNEITLLTYHAIRDNIPETTFETLIIDEAQNIKNSTTKLAQSLRKVKANFRLSLTGTPIENHLNDLISQFEFLLPGMALIPDSASLFKKVRPFILRRKKEEVLKDLPARDDQIIFTSMTEEQKTFYDDFLTKGKNRLLLKVKENGVKNNMEIFELILRLRQIACHPLLMTDQVSTSGKLERVILDLNECIEEGSKVLIFSQFTSLLTLLKREISHPFLYLDGETKDRQAIVDQFQNDPNSKLLISSLKVGGVGLNLTEADYVFILDPWWNDAIEEQAISRAHRMGRTKPVISRRYIAQGTIEEKMLALKEQKTNLSDNLFNESNFDEELFNLI